MQSLTVSEICKKLSISEATARNWIRLGKITLNKDGKTFDSNEINKLIASIHSAENSSLKKRRNKKQAKGISAYDKYIVSNENIKTIRKIVAQNNKDVTLNDGHTKLIRLVLANYALQLVLQKMGETDFNNNLLPDFLEGRLDLGIYSGLVSDLIDENVPGDYTRKISAPNEDQIPRINESVNISMDEISQISCLLEFRLTYYSNEDTLGCLYLSLRDIAERKTSGAYYTPHVIARALIESVSKETSLESKRIIDPCCGTGNFLKILSDFISSPKSIFGSDIDELCVKICRLNIALSYNISDISILYENIKCRDMLVDTTSENYDVILGNPPWGYDFSGYDIAFLQSNYKTAGVKGSESYDLFIEKSIEKLSENGYLSYVVPEALLNVKAHEMTRKIIIDSCSFKLISYVGNAFNSVQCPAIIMSLQKKDAGKSQGCKVMRQLEFAQELLFTIERERCLESEVFSFNISDENLLCINKIEGIEKKAFLKNNAIFALGIVTGDNEKHILKLQEADKQKGNNERYEIILKGSDILKYRILPTDNFLIFQPASFQQTAKEEFYRAPEKLLYRFISSTPVFTYDCKMRLSLNSCNILIPHIQGMKIKYILAILNSRVSAYYFQMKFNSVKVLKSHIEKIPIPIIDEKEQKKIVELVDKMLDSSDSIEESYCILDNIIMDIFELSESERRLILAATTSKNEYLPKEITQ